MIYHSWKICWMWTAIVHSLFVMSIILYSLMKFWPTNFSNCIMFREVADSLKENCHIRKILPDSSTDSRVLAYVRTKRTIIFINNAQLLTVKLCETGGPRPAWSMWRITAPVLWYAREQISARTTIQVTRVNCGYQHGLKNEHPISLRKPKLTLQGTSFRTDRDHWSLRKKNPERWETLEAGM